MKHLIVCIVAALLIVRADAQTKITRISVLGKWNAVIVEVPNTFYYDLDKDSVSLGDALKSKIPPAQLEFMLNGIKQQSAGFKKIHFSFSADGTFELADEADMMIGAQKGPYTVNETNSTITISGSKAQKQALQAEMREGLLKLEMEESGQKIYMTFRKA